MPGRRSAVVGGGPDTAVMLNKPRRRDNGGTIPPAAGPGVGPALPRRPGRTADRAVRGSEGHATNEQQRPADQPEKRVPRVIVR
ncbi:hypothetical protein KRMM14A1259_12240 [Krasilnikovia sp. MM14-A1259]